MAKCTETELQLLLENAVCDNTQSYVNLSMSPEEYRRLKAGIDQLAAASAEIERLRAENKRFESALEMTLETYNKTVHAGLELLKGDPHA